MKSFRHWKSYQRRGPGGRGGYWTGLVRMLFSRRGTPESVAMGFAVGVFVAFLPVIGIQMLLAALLAALLKGNPVVAMALVWISNPFTFTPMFMFTYRVGTLFTTGPDATRVRNQLAALLRRLDRHTLYDLPAQGLEWIKIGRDTFVPLLIGGVLIGAIAASISFPVVLMLVRRFRSRRDAARETRRAHRKFLP